METYEREFCVRGYHVYKDTWEVAIGEELECMCEQSNTVRVRGSRMTQSLATLILKMSAHLLVLEKRWCDMVSRCGKEKEFRLTSRYKIFTG